MVDGFLPGHQCWSGSWDSRHPKSHYWGTGQAVKNNQVPRYAEKSAVTFSRNLQLIIMCHQAVSAPLPHWEVLFKINRLLLGFM